MDGRKELENIAGEVLELTLAAGATECEVFAGAIQSTEVRLFKLQTESIRRSAARGVGVRILVGKKTAFFASTDLSPGNLKKLTARAVKGAAETTEDPYAGFARQASLLSEADLDVYDPEMESVPTADKIEYVARQEKAALAVDGRIMTDYAMLSDGAGESYLVNSLGVSAYSRGTSCASHVRAMIREGEKGSDASAFRAMRHYKDLTSLNFGAEAGELALLYFGAGTSSGENVTAVYARETAAELLGYYASALSAKRIQQKTSIFAEKREGVASPLAYLADDPSVPRQLGSTNFDDEGNACARLELIAGGNVENLLYNQYAANHEGVASNGRGFRGGFGGTPGISSTNLMLAPGKISEEELISEIKSGVIVLETQDTGNVNTATGDYSVVIGGKLIENGKVTRPIYGVTLAGDLKEMLLNVSAVADNAEWYFGTHTPTYAISGMVCAG